MNDFERRLAEQPLRTVPPGWRRELLATVERTRKTPARALMDWLWPSPVAWAALAVVWMMLAAAFTMSAPLSAPGENARISVAATQPDVAPSVSLFAYHTRPELFGDLARTP
jgi:hypothetical protein